MSIDELIFSAPLLAYAYFIASYALMGGILKYIDDAFDKKAFSKRKAVFIAPLLGVLWALNMALSAASATILAAVVFAAFLTRKINSTALKSGAVVLVLAALAFGVFSVMWLPFAALAIAGIADEISSDYADSKRIRNRLVHWLLAHRFMMKIAVLGFALLALFEWLYFFAFLAFDIAYECVSAYSLSIKHKTMA